MDVIMTEMMMFGNDNSKIRENLFYYSEMSEFLSEEKQSTILDSKKMVFFDFGSLGLDKINPFSKNAVYSADLVKEIIHDFIGDKDNINKKETNEIADYMFGLKGKLPADKRIQMWNKYMNQKDRIKFYEEYVKRGLLQKIYFYIKRFGFVIPKRVVVKTLYQFIRYVVIRDKNDISKSISSLRLQVQLLDKFIKETDVNKIKDNKEDYSKFLACERFNEELKDTLTKLRIDYLKKHWIATTITIIALLTITALLAYGIKKLIDKYRSRNINNESFSISEYNRFLLENEEMMNEKDFDKMMTDENAVYDFGESKGGYQHKLIYDFWNSIDKEYQKDEALTNVVNEINYGLVKEFIPVDKARQALMQIKVDINDESKIFVNLADHVKNLVDEKEFEKYITKRMSKDADTLKKAIRNNKLSLEEKEKVVKKFVNTWGKYDKNISDDIMKMFYVYKRRQKKLSRIKNGFDKYMARGIFTKITDTTKKFGWTVPKRVILKLVFQYTKLFFSSESYSNIDARIKTLKNRITKLEDILKKLAKSTGDEKDIQIYRTRQLIEKNKRAIEKLNSDYIKQHWVPIAVTLILLAVLISVGIYYYKKKKNGGV